MFFWGEGVIVWFRIINQFAIWSSRSLVIVFFCIWVSFVFCSSTFSAFKATKIIPIGFEMNKICFFEVKGVIVWFRLIKSFWNLKLKVFHQVFVVFELQNDFVVLHLTHSKPQKSSNWFWNEQDMFLWNKRCHCLV